VLLLVLALVLGMATPVLAAPGLCVGPICGDEITRSAKHHFQLRMRVSDQLGHRERLTVDCRTGSLSPAAGLVERGYAAALARKACRLAGEASA
jgi:hypothetical protein